MECSVFRMPDGVVVGASAIEGQGVFATRVFGKGEIVLTIDDSRIVDDASPLQNGEDRRHCDYIAGGTVVLMQLPERYINHSCDPNTYVRTVMGVRRVFARGDIAPGEEITYDYSVNGSGDTVWQCHCGAARCRHEIHSDFFHLSIEFQQEYLPQLEEWFQKERAVEVEHLRALLSRTNR
jgi:hypothetical protein